MSDPSPIRTSLPELPRDVLEGFFSLSLDLLCIADLHGHFLLVNPEWQNVLGYSPEDLKGRRFLEFVHPDDVDATLAAMQDLSDKKELMGFENRYRAFDGSYRWIQWRSQVSGDLVYAAARDITDQKNQLRELARLSDLFRQTSAVARVGGWEVNLATKETWWSDVTAQIHECEPGYRPALEEGINFYAEGEDREAITRAFAEAVELQKPYDLELRIRTARGRLVWVRTEGHPVVENGKVVRVIGAFQDIDDRKKAFARLESEQAILRGLFDLAAVGIAMNDFETAEFLMFNDKIVEPSGYTREEFQKLTYWQLTPGEYAELEHCQLTTLQDTGRYGPYEKEYIRKDGSRYPVRLSGFLFKNADGRDVIWSIVQDVSEEKQTEQSLRDAALRAEEANRAKSAFLATMSHEIRTPLNGVIGGTELLRTTRLSPEQESYVEMILHSGDLLLSTINDVLDYSKIESGRIEIENAPFDLVEMVEGLVDAVTPMVRQKGIELVFFPGRGIPRLVVGDSVRIRQVLLNLVSNAIKFTESGYVEVSVSMEEHGAIRFQVEDTGIGIAQNRLAEIFLPFVQAESSTTRQFGGTGLGLSISHRLVALMGGELDVSSTLGHGTCFHFVLQLPVADSAGVSQAWGQEAGLSGKKILVLEDTLINQKLLLHTLDSAKAETTLLADWEAFVAADFSKRSFDIVLIDRFLGSEDLSTKIAEIHEKCGADSRILMLASDITGIPADLCDGLLQKPIKTRQLLDQCHKVLAGQGRRVARPVPPRSEQPTVLIDRLQVLIVEDNRLNQIIARTMLGHLRIKIIHLASNGKEGLEAWESIRPDLILMDCQMPILDGYEATRQIRAAEAALGNGARVPVIGLSAAAIVGDREKALHAGMDYYLTKPLRPEELQSAIEQFLPAVVSR